MMKEDGRIGATFWEWLLIPIEAAHHNEMIAPTVTE